MNLKRTAMACVMLGAAFRCFADVPADTVKVIDNASNIVVVCKDGKTILNAEFPDNDGSDRLHYRYEVNVTDEKVDDIGDEFPDNWGMSLPFVKFNGHNGQSNRVSRRVACLRRVSWGWRFNYSGKGNVKNGWEVSVPDFLSVSWRKRGAEFEIGAGFSMNRYYAMDDFGYQKIGDRLVLSPVPEGMKATDSFFDVFTFQVPVLYNQKIGGGFSFSLGTIVNLNTYAAARTTLRWDDDSYQKTIYKALQQNLFTLDAYASLAVSGFGIFARWSPAPLFKCKYGPQLKSFLIGVEISFQGMN